MSVENQWISKKHIKYKNVKEYENQKIDINTKMDIKQKNIIIIK